MLANTLDDQHTLSSAEALPVDDNLEKDSATAEQAKLAFAFLWTFTFVGFGRPQDLLPALEALHLTLASATLGLVAYLGALFMGRARLLWSTNLLLVLFLTAWFMVGIPFAYYRRGSFEAFTQSWLRTLVFFFLLTQTLTTISRVKKILWAVLSSELIASLASILLQGRAELQEGDRLAGVNQGLLGLNYLGITFSVILPFWAALYLSRISVPQRILLALALCSTMWTVVLTASRGGFLGFLIAAALTWWFVLRGSRRGRALAVLIPFGLIIVLVKAPDVFWSRLETIWTDSSATDVHSVWPQPGKNPTSKKLDAESAEDSTRGRELLLENSLKYTAEFPVFGLGIGGFSTYNGKLLHQADAWHGTHNTFTQMSSEGGIPALILFLWLLFTILGQMKKLSTQFAGDDNTMELRLIAAATLASTLIFAFQGFFAHIGYEYLLYYTAGIAAGVWTISRQNSHEEQGSNAYDEAIASSTLSEM